MNLPKLDAVIAPNPEASRRLETTANARLRAFDLPSCARQNACRYDDEEGSP